MASDSKSRKSRSRRGNIWGELNDVCRKVHERLYAQRDAASARRYQRRLERLLGKLPSDDLAILRHEGAALLCELRGEASCAAEHRKREIQLIERLQRSVARSIAAGEYDAKIGESILAGRDAPALAERRDILRSLKLSSGVQDKKTHKQASRRNGRVG